MDRGWVFSPSVMKDGISTINKNSVSMFYYFTPCGRRTGTSTHCLQHIPLAPVQLPVLWLQLAIQFVVSYKGHCPWTLGRLRLVSWELSVFGPQLAPGCAASSTSFVFRSKHQVILCVWMAWESHFPLLLLFLNLIILLQCLFFSSFRNFTTIFLKISLIHVVPFIELAWGGDCCYHGSHFYTWPIKWFSFGIY